MRKTCVAMLWASMALLLAAGAQAELVADLYKATVPVSKQSSQVLDSASREAMAEVLVKVSGSKAVLQNPVITEALKDARNHIQEYGYVRGTPPAAPLSLRVEFDAAYITQLVAESGSPLWTANRPVVLAWVVVEDEHGRHFINQETAPEEARRLVEEFSRRGVVVQLPVFDLLDTAAVSVADVWTLDANTLLAASARYNVQDVLAGRLATTSGGKSHGDWSYFRQEERINRSVSVTDLSEFLVSGVNIVVSDMASRYAVAPTGGAEGGVQLSIIGVSDYADYAAIVNWLEKLELVESVRLERVQDERVEFRLQAKTDAAQLASIVELNERLTPVPVLGDTTKLNFQWRQ